MSTTTATNGVAVSNGTHETTKVISPAKFAHVVLRTNNIKQMTDYYVTFLGGRIVHENPQLAFMTYDDEHHRVAFIQMPGCSDKVKNSNGLEHIAFTFPTLESMLTAYRQRLTHLSTHPSMKPVWNVHHGPTVSLYYKDPDGNMIETQFDVYGDDEAAVRKATEMMESDAFKVNPIGWDFEPDELYARLQKEGEEKVLMELRKSRGPQDGQPRGVESLPKAFLE